MYALRSQADTEFSSIGGLFVVNQDPQAMFLVETNPLFAEHTNFLGSEYFTDQLQTNPEVTSKRLGDAFYETRLIRDAIFAQTGQRFLANASDGQRFKDDTEQMRYLMDNGIAGQQALQLSLGVALSEDQIANLTHDLVWLVEQEVEGQKVLVPVYYAAQLLDSDLSNGALLLGGQVDLNANNLANTGTISADDSLSINTAQNLLNQSTITAANNLSLVSSGSLGNFVELPDGDHYLSGYENRITFAKTMTEFLQSHLNPQTTLSVR